MDMTDTSFNEGLGKHYISIYASGIGLPSLVEGTPLPSLLNQKTHPLSLNKRPAAMGINRI